MILENILLILSAIIFTFVMKYKSGFDSVLKKINYRTLLGEIQDKFVENHYLSKTPPKCIGYLQAFRNPSIKAVKVSEISEYYRHTNRLGSILPVSDSTLVSRKIVNSLGSFLYKKNEN